MFLLKGSSFSCQLQEMFFKKIGAMTLVKMSPFFSWVLANVCGLEVCLLCDCCANKSNRVVVDMPLSLLHFVHKTFVVSAQPIRTRHFITGSMSSLHYDGRQSAAVTLVGPFFPFLTSLFVTPACTPRQPSQPSCRHAVNLACMYVYILQGRCRLDTEKK